MSFKTCIKCGEIKPLNLFTKNKCSKYGHRNECIICYKEKQKEYRKVNNDTNKIYSKVYRSENKESLAEYQKEYNKINYVKDKKREWYLNNLEYYSNLEKTNKRREYRKLYNSKSLELKWWLFLYHTLKRMGKSKEGHTIDELGYSALDLKQHLESLFTEGMNWDNYGEWHIDHIKPLSKFNLNSPIFIVNALSNLQPLWSTTREINGVLYEGNINKGNKYYES
jgi:hypothetical protein